jgi:energy-coupling factor transport system ATP-binding protein
VIRLEKVTLLRPSSAAAAAPQGARTALLDAIDLEIRAGEQLAIVGANGAGKSLLLQVIAGLRRPSSGHVRRDPDDLRTALVFQTPDDQIVGSTVERDLAFGLENRAVPAPEMRCLVDAMLDRIGLADRRRDAPHLLSEGEKQRLALGAALLMEPAVLLLDEPTSRLDAEGRRRFLEEVRRAREETNAAVVHVTHRSEEAMTADRVVGLRAGRVVFDGTPAEFLSAEEDLGVRWSELHAFRRALRRHGVDVPGAGGDWWNDAEVLLDQLGLPGSAA